MAGASAGSARLDVQSKSFINIEKLQLTFNCPSVSSQTASVLSAFFLVQTEVTPKKEECKWPEEKKNNL